MPVGCSQSEWEDIVLIDCPLPCKLEVLSMTLSDWDRKVGILQVQFAHVVVPVQKVLYTADIFHLEVLMFGVKI